MELLKQFVDLFLHLDTHLSQVIAQYGTWTYLILFVIMFCETGLVVTPFLPATRCCSPPAPSPRSASSTSGS